MVMVDDNKIKINRLILLNKLKQLFNLVADFNS
jgi:glycyl-tRNA synthetase beta subunit